MVKEIAKKIIVASIIILLVVFAIFIIRPFISALLLSLVLAYIFYPFYTKLTKIVKYKSLSAAIICIVVVAIFAGIFWLFVPVILKQIYAFYGTIQKIDIAGQITKIFYKFPEEFQKSIIVVINQASAKTISFLMDYFAKAVSNLPFVFMQLVVTFFIFFFSLRDGEKIASYLKSISPFHEEAEKKFLKHFKDVTYSVIYGMFIVGIIEGLLAGIGFYVFHAPHALFLTLLATFFSVLPLTGSSSWIVWLPTAIGMIITGNVHGIYLIIFGICVLIWIDPVLRPYIVGKRTEIHHGVALLGMLGGYLLFGIIGFIVGPLMLGYLILFFEFYKAEKLHKIFK